MGNHDEARPLPPHDELQLVPARPLFSTNLRAYTVRATAPFFATIASRYAVGDSPAILRNMRLK